MIKTLRNVTDERLRVYIVWLPIFGGDFKGEQRKLSQRFRDKRVSYFSDSESLSGKLWEQVLKTGRPIAWDVYLLYQPDAKWKEEPPEPDYWMHQLGGVTKAPRFDEETFRARLREMIGEIKTAGIGAANANRGLKVEFLYFRSCPGYKQALANLKAALRESGIRSDLRLISVESEKQAERIGFQGSPSIRVNGKDLDGRNEGHSFACRIYQIGGKVNAIPTKEFIQEKLTAMRLSK